MKNKFLSYSIAVIICFCCICAIIGAFAIFLNENIISTPTPASLLPQPNFSTIIVQTAAAAQTQTMLAMPPIVIDTPTNIPASTLNPSADNSYALAVISYATQYGNAMEQMGELLQKSSLDTNLIFDSTWKLDVAAQLSIMQISGDGLGTIPNPPQKFQQTDYWMKQVSEENKLLISNITAAIDNLDTESMLLANQNINNISVFFQNGMVEMERALSTEELNSAIPATPTIFIFSLQTDVAQPTDFIFSTDTPFTLPTQIVQQTQPPSSNNCEPAYPDVCINDNPRLSCADLRPRGIFHFRVLPPDPLGYDRDNDGIGCE